MDEQQEEVTLDLSEILELLRKKKKLIIIITLISVLASGLISQYVIKPTYESKVSVVIGKTDSQIRDDNGYNQSDVMMYQNLVKTYAAIADSQYVAEQTINDIKLNTTYGEFKKNIKVEPQNDTQILDLKVLNNSPEKARDIAQSLTENFIDRAAYLIPNNEVKIMDKAQKPVNPIKPNKKLNVAIAFFLGLLVSVGIAFLQEYMDRTIKSEKDLEKLVDVPVIGVIPQHKTE